MFSTDVFERRRSEALMIKELPQRLYVMLISALTFTGVIASLISAQITMHMDPKSEDNWMLGLVVLVSAFAGMALADRAKHPATALLGYAMIVIPFGLLLGPVLATYTTASVVKVLLLVSVLVVVLGIIGTSIPQSMEHLGGAILVGLIALLVAIFVTPFIARVFGIDYEMMKDWVSWAGVLLFSGITIYDFNRMMHIPRTFKNVVDVSIAIYLNFINIVVFLLEVMGVKSSSTEG